VQFLTCAPAEKKFLQGANQVRTEGKPRVPSSYLALRIHMYNNCREKCANLTSFGQRTSAIIAVGGGCGEMIKYV
jgi:hypothetical protein